MRSGDGHVNTSYTDGYILSQHAALFRLTFILATLTDVDSIRWCTSFFRSPIAVDPGTRLLIPQWLYALFCISVAMNVFLGFAGRRVLMKCERQHLRVRFGLFSSRLDTYHGVADIFYS